MTNQRLFLGTKVTAFPTDGSATPCPQGMLPDADDNTCVNNVQCLEDQALVTCMGMRLEAGSKGIPPRPVPPSKVDLTVAITATAAITTIVVHGVNKDDHVQAVALTLARAPDAVMIDSWQECNGLVLKRTVEERAVAQKKMEAVRADGTHNASLASTAPEYEFCQIAKVAPGVSYTFAVVVRRPLTFLAEVAPAGRTPRAFSDVAVVLPRIAVGTSLPTTLTVTIDDALEVVRPRHEVVEEECKGPFRDHAAVVWFDPAAFSAGGASLELARGLPVHIVAKVRVAREHMDVALALRDMHLGSSKELPVTCHTLPSGFCTETGDARAVSLVTVRVPSTPPKAEVKKAVHIVLALDESGSMHFTRTPGFDAATNERISKMFAAEIVDQLRRTQLPALVERGFLHPSQPVVLTVIAFHGAARVLCERVSLGDAAALDALRVALEAPGPSGGTSFCAAGRETLRVLQKEPRATEHVVCLKLTDGGCHDRSAFRDVMRALADHAIAFEAGVVGWGRWLDPLAVQDATTFGLPYLVEEPHRDVVARALALVPRLMMRVLHRVDVEVAGPETSQLQVLAVHMEGASCPPDVRLPSPLHATDGVHATCAVGDAVTFLVRHPTTWPALTVRVGGVATTVRGEESFELVDADDKEKRIDMHDALAHLRLIDPLYVTSPNTLLLPSITRDERRLHTIRLGKHAMLNTSETTSFAIVKDALAGPPKEAIPVERGLFCAAPAEEDEAPFVTRSMGLSCTHLPPMYRSLGGATGDDADVEYRSMGCDADIVERRGPPSACSLLAWSASAGYVHRTWLPTARRLVDALRRPTKRAKTIDDPLAFLEERAAATLPDKTNERLCEVAVLLDVAALLFDDISGAPPPTSEAHALVALEKAIAAAK